MASNTLKVEDHNGKHQRPSKGDGVAPFKTETAIRKTHTARQMKFIQKWNDVLQSLREGDKLSPEEGNKQFDHAIEYINEVKREKERCYLLDLGLPEAMGVVLESQYLVDSFHKKCNELVQTTLTFALDGLDTTSAVGACKLLIDICQHRFFSEVVSEGIMVDPKHRLINREFLTQSKRIKTLSRLTDVLHTFNEQKGYETLLDHLSAPNQSLDKTYHLLQVVLTLSKYLNTTQSTIVEFIRTSNARLLEAFDYSFSAHEMVLYNQIKDCVAQLVNMVNPPEQLGFTQELFLLSMVSQLLSGYPTTHLPILFLQHPQKITTIINIDATKGHTIADVKEQLCKACKLEPDELQLMAVSNGGVVKKYEDHHSIQSMALRSGHNIAYQVPEGWKRRYIQIRVIEARPSKTFVPFFVYLRRKDLTAKFLYESVIPSAYTFTMANLSEQPFALKGEKVTSGNFSDIPNSVNYKPFPDAKKGDTVTVRIDWSDTANSTPLQANELITSKTGFIKVEVISLLSALLEDPSKTIQCLFKSKEKSLRVGSPEKFGGRKYSDSRRKSLDEALFLPLNSASSSSSPDPKHKEDKHKEEKHKEEKHKEDKHKEEKHKDKHHKHGDEDEKHHSPENNNHHHHEEKVPKEKRHSKNQVEDASSPDAHHHHHQNTHLHHNRTAITSSQSSAIAVLTLFDRFFAAILSLVNSFDLDMAYSALALINKFSADNRVRDTLMTGFNIVEALNANLNSPSPEVRFASSQALTFYGHDTFFYQRPVDTYESWQHVSRTPPTHLNHVDSGALQFLYQINSLRTIDLEFIQHAGTEELFWFIPLIFQVIKQSKVKKEGLYAASNLRTTIHVLLERLQELSYLRQFTLWLKISSLIDEREFDMEWAVGSRFASTMDFFKTMAGTMPANIEVGRIFHNIDIMDPMHDASGHNLPLGSVQIKKIFTSKAKPCLLEMSPSDSKYPSRLVIFKKGDDLRQDLLVQVCFYFFNVLWDHCDLLDKPFIHQYRLIPMGPDTGCVEFVQDCESLNTFDFNKAWPKYTEEDKSLLLRSAAGSYVAGWIMGVRDRHQDNMMIQRSNRFFHIDLGHIFNEKPTIDAPRFAIPPDMKTAMTSADWDRFKTLCANGFKILHRHSGMLINLICILFDGVADLKKVRPFLASPHSLIVNLDEEESIERIKGLIESGVSSIWRANKWGIHSMFQRSGDKAQEKADKANAEKHAQALLQQAQQAEASLVVDNKYETPRSMELPLELSETPDRTGSNPLAMSDPVPPKKRKSSRPKRVLKKLIGNITNPNTKPEKDFSPISNPTSPRSPGKTSSEVDDSDEDIMSNDAQSYESEDVLIEEQETDDSSSTAPPSPAPVERPVSSASANSTSRDSPNRKGNKSPTSP